jgi:hypothetical protein
MSPTQLSSLTSSITPSYSITKQNSIPLTATFSEAVNDLALADWTLAPSGTTVTNLVGANGATTYTFDLIPPSETAPLPEGRALTIELPATK